MPARAAGCRNWDPGCGSVGIVQRGRSWVNIPKMLNHARTKNIEPCAHRARTIQQLPLKPRKQMGTEQWEEQLRPILGPPPVGLNRTSSALHRLLLSVPSPSGCLMGHIPPLLNSWGVEGQQCGMGRASASSPKTAVSRLGLKNSGRLHNTLCSMMPPALLFKPSCASPHVPRCLGLYFP